MNHYRISRISIFFRISFREFINILGISSNHERLDVEVIPPGRGLLLFRDGVEDGVVGLIRQYIPKGTDFGELTDEMLAEIEWKLNHWPRKSLGYRTPFNYCKQLFIFNF